MSKQSKKYRVSKSKITQSHYPLEEAIKLIKETAGAKFDESIEAHFNLGIDPKKSEQIVKGLVNLPHGTGRTIKIAAFTESQAAEAKAAGADLVGGKDLIEEIVNTKKTPFAAAVATPDMMRDLAKAAKILGPRGLMPSPKTGTVATDLAKIINQLKTGQVTLRNDSLGNIHQIIGKVSWENLKIKENYQALLAEIKRQKPKGLKGVYIKNISLCSTMGPGVKIQT